MRCAGIILAGLTMFSGVLLGPHASASLITALDATVVSTPSGYLYKYSLTNEVSSDLSVVWFALNIAPGSDLQSITAPLGWDTLYNAGDSIISWESPAAPFDIQPGTLGTFSFLSALGPVPSDFLIVGLDEIIPRIESNQGQIASPGANAIPEPSSILLCGVGLLSVLGYARQRGGRGGAPENGPGVRLGLSLTRETKNQV